MKRTAAELAPVAEAAGRILGARAAGLGAWRPLRGGDRSKVWRVRVGDAPTVVVKAALAGEDEAYDPDAAVHGPASRLFDEWAALALVARLDPAGSLAPRLIGGDRGAGVLVMEDVRPGQGLDRLLLGADRDAAAEAIRAYAGGLGHLHALTAGRDDEHAAIRAELGPVPPTPVSTAAEVPLGADGVVAAWRRAAEILGVPSGSRAEDDAASVGAFWAEPPAPRALVHSDACPDNCLVGPGGVRFLDFEFAGFRHPLVDGATVRLGFPSCWCAGTLPEGVLEAAEAAYRAALGTAYRWAADDAAFGRALILACGYWTLGMLTWAVPALLQEDVAWGRAGGRQRVLHRLGLFAELAERRGHLRALGAAAAATRARLAARWPADAAPPGLFPAFG